MVWGHNAAFQLGNGKRANLSVPQHLPPLPALTKALGGEAPLLAEEVPSEKERQRLREADINSGALTHMPVSGRDVVLSLCAVLWAQLDADHLASHSTIACRWATGQRWIRAAAWMQSLALSEA